VLEFFHLKKWRALSEYMDGRLSPKRSGRLERHLACCNRCREAYEELQVTREALGALKVAVEQDSFLATWSAIEARLRCRPLSAAFFIKRSTKASGAEFLQELSRNRPSIRE